MRIPLLVIISTCIASCKHPKADEMKRTQPASSYMEGRIQAREDFQKNVLPMRKSGGVRYVTIEVNGFPLEFVFDTGASSISISIAEAYILHKQGSLTDDDFIGVEEFQDATGRISEGMIINLRKVKVGNQELHNIEAIVVNNEKAPLLLGQSVLEKFGSIEIDNANNQIILKN